MASARAAHGSSPLRPTNTLVLSTTLLLACVATAAATAPGGTSAADPYGPGAAAAAAARCPPPGFNTVPHLNLSAYISAPFYVQKQLPVSYQGEDPLAYLYCVRAVYRPFAAAAAAGPTQGSLASAAPQRATPSGLLVVENYANEGRVNGPPVGTSSDTIRAPLLPTQLVALPDPAAAGMPTAASKLLVGPALFLNTLTGPGWRVGFGQYWVVAVKTSNDSTGYDWAIISGGAPAFSGPNGCSMDPPPVEYYNPSSDGGGGGGGLFGWLASTLQRLQRKVARAVGAVRDARTGSSRGLWLFSRKPVDPEGTAQMERVAMELGFDISGLRTVEQEGCAYGDKELPPGTVVTPPDAAAKAAAAATPPPNTPNVSVAPAAAAAPKGDESRKLH